jgi:hypothetical protein
MTKQEQIDALEDAQQELLDALDNLKHVAREINSSTLSRIIIPAIECAVTGDHEWLDRSDNLDDMIAVLRGEYYDEQEAEPVESDDDMYKPLVAIDTPDPELLPGAVINAIEYGITKRATKIHAIVWLRKRYSLGLKEAKSYIDKHIGETATISIH